MAITAARSPSVQWTHPPGGEAAEKFGARMNEAARRLGFIFALRRGQSVDLQLNVENVFGQEDRLPYSATAPGVIVRYLLPRVRHNWTVRATYGF